MMRIFHDHQVIATHPAGSTLGPQANGDLVVTEPAQVTGTTYKAGTWHGASETLPCAGYVTPNPACPNCYLPAPAVVPSLSPLPTPPLPAPIPSPPPAPARPPLQLLELPTP